MDRRTFTERFEARVDRAQGPEGCWEWRGAHSNGYAVWRFKGQPAGVHRAAYLHFIGPIPEGLELDHLCRNRGCVNPTHTEPVTTRVNGLRGIGESAQNSVKTHCPQGHPYDAVNTRLARRPNGRIARTCRTCIAAKGRAYRDTLDPEVKRERWRKAWHQKVAHGTATAN